MPLLKATGPLHDRADSGAMSKDNAEFGGGPNVYIEIWNWALGGGSRF